MLAVPMKLPEKAACVVVFFSDDLDFPIMEKDGKIDLPWEDLSAEFKDAFGSAVAFAADHARDEIQNKVKNIT